METSKNKIYPQKPFATDIIFNNYHYLVMTNTRKYHVTDGQRNANKTDGDILINEIHSH